MRPAGEVVFAQGSDSERNPRLGLPELLGDIEQVAGRARQSVEAVDDDDITVAKMVEQPRQLRPAAVRSRELLFIYPRAPGLAERGALQLEVLVVGRDPCVADQHR